MNCEIKQTILEINKLLNELDECYDNLPNELSKVDSAICDLLHLIENNILKTNQSYRVIRELHKLRIERRKIKNNMELMSTFRTHQNKLLNVDNRKILLSEIGKKEKSLNMKYNNRIYTDEEIKEMIGDK